MRSICGPRSSGIFSRVALYSGYRSSRKVRPVSKATARYSGCSFSISESRMEVKPNTPAVGSPAEVIQRAGAVPPPLRAK
jgi:hypothetical protein